MSAKNYRFGALCALAAFYVCASSAVAGPPNPTSSYSNAGATDPDRAVPIPNAKDDPAAAPQQNTARQAVADIFNAAKSLAAQKQYAAALTKLQEADAIPDLTRYESGLIETLRIVAALQTDNNPVAIKALQGLPDTVTAEQRSKYAMAITVIYFNAQDYPGTIEWAKRYLSEGGSEQARAESLLTRSYYFSGDYADALQSVIATLTKKEQAGEAPKEDELQVYENAALKQKDQAQYIAALTKLVTYFPTADRWDDLIQQTIIRPGYPWEKRALDVFRLEMAVGTLRLPLQVNGYVAAAIQAGYPAEAVTVLDHGPDVANAALRASATKALESDRKDLPAAEIAANKSANGDALVKLGIDYYGYGQYDKALALIQAGKAKGGLKSPDDANLALGIVYLAAGQKDKAADTFKSVTQTGGPAELAQLWALKARNDN